jgi:hypothetical protein
LLIKYHQQITREALEDKFSSDALETIINANLKQDGIRYQVAHSYFHFDNNAFYKSYAYIKKQRTLVFSNLEKSRPIDARENFGRLLHAVQDLYAHSNYVDLLLENFDPDGLPEPGSIEPCDQQILASPNLSSGRLYYPFEAISFIPKLRRLVLPFLPRDSHAWMNLDSPASGNRFPYAFSAAVKRTQLEFEEIHSELSTEKATLFLDSRL